MIIKWTEKEMLRGPNMHLGHVGKILCFNITKALNKDGFYLTSLLTMAGGKVFCNSVAVGKVSAEIIFKNWVERLEFIDELGGVDDKPRAT